MKKTLMILVSAIFALFMMASCDGDPKPLTEGQWSNENVFGTTTYIFNTDGTGQCISDDYNKDFTYTIEGDTITMNDGGIFLSEEKYAYTIKGKKLTLKGGSFISTETTYEWEERK